MVSPALGRLVHRHGLQWERRRSAEGLTTWVYVCCASARRMQGIDIVAGGRNKKVHRTAPKSDNVYLKLLVKASGGAGARGGAAAAAGCRPAGCHGACVTVRCTGPHARY